MTAIAFLLLIWGISLFYQREHAAYVIELREIAATGDIKQRDWRITGREGSVLQLRRSFHIRTRMDLLRYALPVLFFALILIMFGSWFFAFLYLTVLTVKWFATITEVDTDPRNPHYCIRLFGRKIFVEKF